MNKKGVELTVNTIIVVALGLLVLFVLFFVLQKNILGGSQRYINLSLEAERELKSQNICEKLFSGRACMENCGMYEEIPGQWTDCPGQKCCKS